MCPIYEERAAQHSLADTHYRTIGLLLDAWYYEILDLIAHVLSFCNICLLYTSDAADE